MAARAPDCFAYRDHSLEGWEISSRSRRNCAGRLLAFRRRRPGIRTGLAEQRMGGRRRCLCRHGRHPGFAGYETGPEGAIDGLCAASLILILALSSTVYSRNSAVISGILTLIVLVAFVNTLIWVIQRARRSKDVRDAGYRQAFSCSP